MPKSVMLSQRDVSDYRVFITYCSALLHHTPPQNLSVSSCNNGAFSSKYIWILFILDINFLTVWSGFYFL